MSRYVTRFARLFVHCFSAICVRQYCILEISVLEYCDFEKMSVFHSGMSLFSLFCAFLFHQYWQKYTSNEVKLHIFRQKYSYRYEIH